MCLNSALISLIRHAYLSSYQILSTEDYQADFSDPKAKGAGFIIEYNHCKYLVSALHVIDPKNYPDFTSWEPDPKVAIVSGKNDSLSQLTKKNFKIISIETATSLRNNFNPIKKSTI